MCFAGPEASVISRVGDGKHIVQFAVRNTCESLNHDGLGRYDLWTLRSTEFCRPAGQLSASYAPRRMVGLRLFCGMSGRDQQ